MHDFDDIIGESSFTVTEGLNIFFNYRVLGTGK